jgi:4-hydroxy-tetrahydrodipicolinate reductase
MGRIVLEAAAEETGTDIIAGFDKVEIPHGSEPHFRGAEVPVYADYKDYDDSAAHAQNGASARKGADAIIDFSHYTAVPGLVAWAAERSIPVVVCTTALDEEARDNMRAAAAKIPIFNSSNMSLGINIMAKMAQLAIPALEQNFNVEIIEKHHNKKVDSPSGTAILLADAINDVCKVKKDYVYGRHSKHDEVKITDLGIHALRGGTLPGEHTILFAGPDEVIEITHTVYSRKVFAQGALAAAHYIAEAGRKPGAYDMNDIIG